MNTATHNVVEAATYPEFGRWVEMEYSLDRSGTPQEGGRVRFSWDDAGFYVRAELVDACIIAQNRADEQLHYLSGDVFELFMNPLNEAYYWEMYATPTGHKSTLFFPEERRDLGLKDFLHGHSFRGLDVSVDITPIGWDVQMFVPAEQLTACGAAWGDTAEWTVLCGRYNYHTDELIHPELSMAPMLSRTNFHLTDEYALMELSF